MRAPGVPGASVLALDPGPGGREAGEGELGADQVDLGAEDTRDQQAEDRGQGEITSGYLALSGAQGVTMAITSLSFRSKHSRTQYRRTS